MQQIFDCLVGESLYIGECIRIYIIETDHNFRTKVGIEAPPDVIVVREELLNTSPTNPNRIKYTREHP